MPHRFGKNIQWREEGDRIILSGTGVITRNQSLDLYEYFSSRIIEIEEGISGIDGPAFREFRRAEEVILPGSLRFIGSLSFFNCDSLKKIGPLPPIQQIAPDAFDHSGYKIDPALWKDAGPLAIDLSIFPYHGNKDKLRLCDEIRAHLRGESPEEQLLHYEFDYRTNGMDGLETHSHAQVNYMALSRILLDEEGFLLAISYGTEDRDWIYLTRTDWVTVGWRSKMEDTYPYYEKYVGCEWVRPAAFRFFNAPDSEENSGQQA